MTHPSKWNSNEFRVMVALTFLNVSDLLQSLGSVTTTPSRYDVVPDALMHFSSCDCVMLMLTLRAF